ncbi:hypothetical protein K438DRAFT_311101 [Mycena galopus ATCC 62051]|nr:hypothetical protein K438DRAFT_311101 [Mycena galopus ATCC 62051]
MVRRTWPNAHARTPLPAPTSLQANPRAHTPARTLAAATHSCKGICAYIYLHGHARTQTPARPSLHVHFPGAHNPTGTPLPLQAHTHPARTPPHEHPHTDVSASALSSHTRPCLPLSICTYSPAHASWHVSPRTDRAARIGQHVNLRTDVAAWISLRTPACRHLPARICLHVKPRTEVAARVSTHTHTSPRASRRAGVAYGEGMQWWGADAPSVHARHRTSLQVCRHEQSTHLPVCTSPRRDIPARPSSHAHPRRNAAVHTSLCS